MLKPSEMTDQTLEANINLYRDNWDTVEDAIRYCDLLTEKINRLLNKKG